MFEKVISRTARVNRRFKFYSPEIRNYAIIIGSMKSGTTYLYNLLSQHQKIYKNYYMKEPEFFSNLNEFNRGLEYYNRQWLPLESTCGWALEASTGYSKFPSIRGVPERISQSLNSVRFIYIMRSPIERILSHLAHNIYCGDMPHKNEYQLHELKHYIFVSQYHSQLKRYEEIFSKSRIMLISFDNLIAKPVETANLVTKFLDIESDFPFGVIPAANVGKRKFSFNFSPEARRYARRVIAQELDELEASYEFDARQWKDEVKNQF